MGGLFLLWPWLASLSHTLQATLPGGMLAVRSGLTLILCALVRIPRRWHLPALHDAGFALLTGGRRVLGRPQLGQWLKAVTRAQWQAFWERTTPLRHVAVRYLEVSLDSHGVPRWSRKFPIAKGYHTVRNKFMKLDALWSVFDVKHQKFCAVVAQPGDCKPGDWVAAWLLELRAFAGGCRFRVLLDAAFSQTIAVLDTLLHLPGITTLVRASRLPEVLAAWQALPPAAFHHCADPSAEQPGKTIEIALTETEFATSLEPMRTVVARELHGTQSKECYHGLYTSDRKKSRLRLVAEFRQRQAHEQAHRHMLTDMALDSLPDTYQRFHPPACYRFTALPMEVVAWFKAVAYNLAQDFKRAVGGPYRTWTVGTLARNVFLRPALLFQTPTHLIVAIQHLPQDRWLQAYVRRLNQKRYRVPWFTNRILLISPLKKGKHSHLSFTPI